MFYIFERFLELIMPLLIFWLVIYWGAFIIKATYKKIIKAITGDVNKKLTYEQKRKVLNIIKIFSGAQVIGLVFYITPAINENIKILLSVLITIGSFLGAFFIEDKSGKNAVTRTLVFLGQEFFGITMILLMVNKGIGYSLNNILAIWTVFNLYIYKKHNNSENKMLLGVTLLGLVVSLLFTYSVDIEMYMLIFVIVIGLLIIHFFANEESMFIKVIYNLLLTLLGILVLVAVGSEASGLWIIFIVSIIYMVTICASKMVLGEVKTLKAFLVYIPYVVMLLLADLTSELFYILILFNILAAIWMISDNSSYKKWICAVIGLFTVPFIERCISIDTTTGVVIYVGALIFVFTCLFAPVKQDVLDKGGENNEE